MNRPDPKAVAREAWGVDVPDWVITLAEAVETSSQSVVGRQIGYTSSVVSSVLRNNYRANLDKIEQAVRGALMASMIPCPELGEIPGQDCIAHQRRASKFQNTNPIRIRMFRACRQCPRHTGAKGDTA